MPSFYGGIMQGNFETVIFIIHGLISGNETICLQKGTRSLHLLHVTTLLHPLSSICISVNFAWQLWTLDQIQLIVTLIL